MNTNHIRGPARAVGLLGTAVATCVLTATTFGVFAADIPDVPEHRAVKVEDLNLSTAADTATLYGRIRHAAKEVCERFDGPSVRQHQLRNKCVTDAIDNAVATLDLPALTKYHLAKNSADKGSHAALTPAS